MRRCSACLLALGLAAGTLLHGQESQSPVTLAWWNVENLFDTQDDTLTLDDDFTPQGANHWTPRKLKAKTGGIYKTLAMMDMPDLVGLAEVENGHALQELCLGTPLRQAGYRFVHYDSPDRRGIDCALLYRHDRFRVLASRNVSLSDSAASLFTRDILLVQGLTPHGDTLCILLNHWPSKLGGATGEQRRMHAACTLRSLMDSLKAAHPQAAVVALGDMNCTAEEAPVAEGMGFGNDSVNTEGIRNLTLRLPPSWGSHKYQGRWSYIDQAYFLAGSEWTVVDIKLVRFGHLLEPEKRYPGHRPRRTYYGPRYAGGFSDHLPLLLTVAHSQNR